MHRDHLRHVLPTAKASGDAPASALAPGRVEEDFGGLGSCLKAWCSFRGSNLGHPLGPGRSGYQGRQADGVTIADRGDAFQRHVSGPLDGPFVVLFEQNSSDKPLDGGFVGEDADDICPALDLAVDAFERIGRMSLGPMSGRERHIGQDIFLRTVHESG